MQLHASLIGLLEQVDGEFSPPLSQRLSLASYADKIIANAVIFPLIEAGRMTAFVAMYCNDPDGKTAYITMVATEPAGRGKGLASGLVGLAIHHARRRGFQQVALEVYRSNLSALNLYRKLGFVVAGETDSSHYLNFQL